MKNRLLLLGVLVCSLARLGQAQCTLIDATYAVQPTQTVIYAWEQRINLHDGSKTGFPVPVEMDLYRPVNLPGEEGLKRPVVILAHGVLELKDAPRWVAMATSLAQRGYVVASLNYRMDPNLVTALLDAGTVCGTAACKLAAFNRMTYCNAMDIHKAMGYMIANQNLYGIDPNRFILGGHSMGAASTIIATTVSKPEVAQFFPLAFWLDPYYVNLDVLHSRIKGALLFGPPVSDLGYFDATDNVPAFIFAGTHDCVTPFYSGRQLCQDETNILAYGGAAIAQRLDQLTPAQSYYFVEARGVGHTIGICDPAVFPNPADDLQQLYFPDMLRFMKTTMLDGYVNQIHKVLTPLNTSPFDYCEEASVAFGPNVLAETFVVLMATSGGTCFNFPAFTLSTLPWNGPAYGQCSFPPLYPAPAGLCGVYLKQGGEEGPSSGHWPDASHVIPAFAASAPGQGSDGLWVHPNPCADVLMVGRSGVPDGEQTLVVRNLQGVELKRTKLEKGNSEVRLDLVSLPAGIYLVELHGVDGRMAQQRFVRQ